MFEQRRAARKQRRTLRTRQPLLEIALIESFLRLRFDLLRQIRRTRRARSFVLGARFLAPSHRGERFARILRFWKPRRAREALDVPRSRAFQLNLELHARQRRRFAQHAFLDDVECARIQAVFAPKLCVSFQ